MFTLIAHYEMLQFTAYDIERFTAVHRMVAVYVAAFFKYVCDKRRNEKENSEVSKPANMCM